MNELIKEIRIKCGMNQAQFAKVLGTTTVAVNRWENEKNKPNKMAQMRLLEFCRNNNIDLYEKIINSVAIGNNEKDLVVYHGSKKGITGKIAPISCKFCDFGKGFYVSTNPIQPLTLICGEDNPVFYTMKLDLSGLKILNLDMDIDWAMLIAYNRGYMDEVKGSNLYMKYKKMTEGYDVILGFIADDRMFRVLKSFFEKEITDTALIQSLSALDLGSQCVLKTEKACNQIRILDSKYLSFFERGILRDKNIIRRQEGVDITERILLKYRREGRFFDEILKGE